MNLIENLVDFFKKPEAEIDGRIPEGLCPVCWGHQEYDKKIRRLYKDKQVDINNHKDSYMLIQDFVIQHIDGITLKEDKIDACPTCGEADRKKKRYN